MPQRSNFPMLRNVPKPLHTGRLEASIAVEAAGDGAVNDNLLLLLQQCDQLLLGADVTRYAPVYMVEKQDNCCLVGFWWAK